MNNTFKISIEADGKIRLIAEGGFSQEVHCDADEFLEMLKDLAGGPCETKRLQPNLGNPHAHQHQHGHKHSH